MTDVPEFSVRERDRRPRLRPLAVVPREGRVVPAEHRRRGDADVHGAIRTPRRRRAAAEAAGARPACAAPTGTVLIYHSMIKLPEKPMMPRLFDERVGYFTQGTTDYGTDEHQSVPKRFITRYRLEKKDPSAAMSEPVKPIVYYIDPATPTKWVPYLKQGIEDWQPAFEAAGFKNAIIAKEAPNGRSRLGARGRALLRDALAAVDDRERGRARTCTIRAAARFSKRTSSSTTTSMNLTRDWYFVQVGPLDPRAQQAAAARRAHGPADALRRRARDRPHARLPAQHEGQLDVHDRADSRSEVGPRKRPHAVDHGLLALQLRRAARGRHRDRRSRAEDRSLRQVGHALGLRADSRREDARPGEADARQVGARAGRRSRTCGSRPKGRAAPIPATRPRPSATATR